MTCANFHALLTAGRTPIGTPVTLGSTQGAGGTNSVTLTTAAAIPAGCLVVVGVYVGFGTSQSISGVSDGTNSYTKAVGNVYDGTTQTVLDIWYKENASAVSSSASLTATFSAASLGGSNVPIINAAYVTGILTSSSLDKSSTGTQNSGTAYASGSTTTLAQANEIAFGFMAHYNASATDTEGSGFTNINTTSKGSANWWMSRLSYQTVSATTALNYQPSTSVATIGKVSIATFKGN